MAFTNVGGVVNHAALRTNFGHSPTGALGGHQVQQVQAGGPRLQNAPIAQHSALRQLASRILNAITPASMRVEQKVRDGLSDSSAHIGKMLGALMPDPHGNLDAQLLGNLEQALPAVAQPVTQRGVSLDKLAQQRIIAHLANMTPAQRTALCRGLQAARNQGLDNDPSVSRVNRAIGQYLFEIAPHSLGDALADAIDQSEQMPPPGIQTTDLLEPVLTAARDLLTAQGLGAHPDMEGLAHGAVNGAMESYANVEDAHTFSLAALLNRLPSNTLHDLGEAQSFIPDSDTFLTSTALFGALGFRADKLEAAIIGQADTLALLLTNAPSLDVFASAVTDLGQLVGDLRQHEQTHDMHSSANVAAKLNTLHAALDQTVDQYNNFDQLTDSQLYDVDRNLKILGGTSATVEGRITQRKAEAFDDAVLALAPVMVAVESGDLSGMLRELDRAVPDLGVAVDRHMAMGADLNGEDQNMTFRADIVTAALNSLSPNLGGPVSASLISVTDVLTSTPVTTLTHALTDGSDALMGMRDHPASNRTQAAVMMVNRKILVNIMQICSEEVRKSRGLDAPNRVRAPRLDDAAIEALREGLGVQLSKTGDTLKVESWPVSAALRSAIETEVDSIVSGIASQDQSAFTLIQTDEGQDALPVHKEFLTDLPRAAYSYENLSGAKQSIDRQSVSTRQGVSDAIAALTNEACGGNAELMSFASCLAYQVMGAAVYTAMYQPDADGRTELNPIRLKGAPGMVMAGPNSAGQDDTVSYHLRAKVDGSVDVQMHSAIAASLFNPISGGSPQMLDPDQSQFNFSYTLNINASHEVRLTGPVTLGYNLVPLSNTL